ncbi:MAG: sigma 54-interacting transcriptional regulator [Deltaproteobacteria bacterium]|nr:sigma 54-interacting transcriptional regulator [Deltaproteobacteria bacterium]MBW1923968.1 sigma 54-interacting transcriptional regulator [Deltaproteobacteria bacterium]MBW1948493.1 sigma 54-interacting transcriptional regulator [Deltaproteobacteria bacterium]MBW2006658.1 sigma 54-interacting transcriptional regulator [Deltaproteobacteria bacterium]MBW2101196.1 sigma 54-interacting transcriptional regulator [Deltaproteobacteria bacterium]
MIKGIAENPGVQQCEDGFHLAPSVGPAEDLEGLLRVFELVMEDVFSGVILCDRDSRILYMNKFYADLLRTTPERARGSHISEYFPESRLPEVMRTGRVELGRKCSLRTDFALLVNRIPIKRNDETVGVILQTTFRDFTEVTELLGRLNLLEKEVNYYKRGLDSILSATYTFDAIIGRHERLVSAKRTARKYAETDAPVLILGATGTGKELFAHAVHLASRRRRGPFVCVNCAAIPRELLESELFGYTGGAFTGAKKGGKQGKIEMAHRGTLFLDEIGDMPLSAQAKLLRVLETKRVEKVGGVKGVEVDFRLVAATNRALRDMIERGEFREDFYYRLNTMTVEVPELSRHTEDIPLLVEHFLRVSGHEEVKLTDAATEALKRYAWPGNVRELKNVIERAVSLTESGVIDVEHLPREILELKAGCEDRSGSLQPLAKELRDYERRILLQALKMTGGNMSKTARLLGISRSTLYEKCRAHDL